MQTIAGTVLCLCLAGTAFGQSTSSATKPDETTAGTAAATPKAPARFEIADVQPSPPRRYPFFIGAFLEQDRYILRQATMVDLIRTAYGLKDPNFVRGGPSWLEWDRWDVIGKVPPGTNEAAAKEMLKNLLEERFKLVAHEGNSEMPAWWLTVAPGSLKMKDTPNGTGDGECHGAPMSNQPGAVPIATLSCTNKSMAALANTLTNNHGGMYLDKPVIDKTGLKGAYDFDLKYTPMFLLARANGAGITIFDAVAELGLKLELKTAPVPGLLVDSVQQTPTPNSPDLGKQMPPLPPAQFDVAVIKPSAPGERSNARITGDEVNAQATPLKFLINFAWDLDPNNKGEIVGAPKWLDDDKIDIEAKVASENLTKGNPGQDRPQISMDDLREMLKQLLIERFEMKVHMEDQTVDAYDLVAVKPKLTKADPNSRTNCHPGPGPDGKDPRLTHPILNMLVTCQNVTMAQAAADFPHFAAYYLYFPAADKTGLQGGWDFTLSWSSGDLMPNFNSGGGQQQAQSQNGDAPASDPNGALSFIDAVNKELGLKLVKVKRAEPVLVIDHMDEQPTPN